MTNKKSMKTLYKEVFGEDLKSEPYKMEDHVFSYRICGKLVCQRCGLVALNNNFTRWSIRMGCRSEDHPNYKSQRNKAGGVK